MTAEQVLKKERRTQVHRLSIDLVKMMNLNHKEVSSILGCQPGTALKKTLDKQDRFFNEQDLIKLTGFSACKARELMLKQREIKNFINI